MTPLRFRTLTDEQKAKQEKFEKRRARKTAVNKVTANKKRNRKYHVRERLVAADLTKIQLSQPAGPKVWTVDPAALERRKKKQAHEAAVMKIRAELEKREKAARAERKKHKIRL